MASFLKHSGEEYPVMPDFGRPDFSIEQLTELVNSPYIEVCPVWFEGKQVYIVADESGFDRNKPFNPSASCRAHKALYGDVVVAKFEELGGRKEELVA